jgi:hypothetical protein
VHFAIAAVRGDADGASESGKWAAIRTGMAQDQVIGTTTPEVEIDIETDPIGPHVVEG